MSWDMGCVVFLNLDSVFLKDLDVRQDEKMGGVGTYGSSVFFCFCANLFFVRLSE
jgi:hypothetical protein